MAWFKIVLKGSIGALENWSTGCSFGIIGLAPDVSDQEAVDGVLANLLTGIPIGDVPDSLRTLLSTSGSMTGWRVEYRAEDETLLNFAEGAYAAPLAGMGAPSKLPQDALVFSLRTATPGAKGRGRMYWPALGATVNTAFQLNSPNNTDVVTGARFLLRQVNEAIDDYYESIASTRRAALAVRSPTDHVCRDVTSIQVGNVLDTQRRRRDLLLESYAVLPYPT